MTATTCRNISAERAARCGRIKKLSRQLLNGHETGGTRYELQLRGCPCVKENRGAFESRSDGMFTRDLSTGQQIEYNKVWVRLQLES